MKDQLLSIKENFLVKSTWIRGLFMLLYFMIYSIARIVTVVVVVFQFGTMLFTGRINERLLGFGQSLASYTYQIIRYLTYNTEQKPFPLSPWPQSSETPDLLQDKQDF